MPKNSFALEAGAPKRLELSWGFAWSNFTVSFDGQEVGRIDKKALEGVNGFRLPDGSELTVQLKKGFGGPQLSVLRNGQPLPGSATDPEALVKAAAYLLFFLAALNAVLGVVALAFDVKVLLDLGMGIGSLVVGVVYSLLGFFTLKQSRVALGIAIALYVLDGVATLAMSVGAGGQPAVGGIVMKVFFTILLVRGFKAIGELKAKQAAVPATAPTV